MDKKNEINSVENLKLENIVNTEKQNLYSIYENELFVRGHTKNGVSFIFDINDYEEVIKHTWYLSKRGYIATSVKRRATPMHKVLLGDTTGFDVDHISRDKLDNRRNNLRLCTHQENSFNQKKRNTNTTGFMGVSFMKHVGRYEAYVHFNGKKYHMGLHNNAFDAAVARDEGAIHFFGEFAHLNFPINEASG